MGMNMATRTSALIALAGSSICLFHGVASAAPIGPSDSALFNGLRLNSPEALSLAGPTLAGRYDWLRLGISPDGRAGSTLALPGQGALGLSVDQFDRRGPGSDAHPRATAMRLQASYLLGDTWGFASQYVAGSLSSPVPSLQSPAPLRESLGVSLFRTGNLLRGDRLSVTLSSPVHTGVSGAMDTGTASAVPAPGDGLIGLRATGREYSTELSYFTPLWHDVGLGFTLSQRQSGLHDYGVPDERMMSIRFSSRF
jgi:hypothetical protein